MKCKDVASKFFEWFKTHSGAVSLIVAVATLIVAIAALIIAKSTLNVSDSSLAAAKQSLTLAEQSLILSSRDLTPVIEFDVDDETGDFYLKNVLPLLFTIEAVDAYKIIDRGVEMKGVDSIVSFSLLTQSAHYEDRHIWFFNRDNPDSNVVRLNINQSIMMVPVGRIFDAEEVRQIDDYLEKHYGMESKEGYALPSQYSSKYLFEVYFKDRIGQYRSVYLIQEHIHGRGWWKDVISEEAFYQELQSTVHGDVDTISNIDSIMLELLFDEDYSDKNNHYAR